MSRYALQLVDTVLINHDNAKLLTEGAKSTKETLFFLSSSSDLESKPSKKPPVKPLANGSPAKHKTVGGKVLRTKTRAAAQEDILISTSAKIAEHQKELHSKLQTEGLEKYSEEGGGGGGNEGKGWKRFQSYKGEGALPPQPENLRVCQHSWFSSASLGLLTDQQIYVDRKAQSVILPVHGFAVPFHINTIKNASKNDEGEFTYLRINFQTPGQLAGRKEDTVRFVYIPSLSKSNLLCFSPLKTRMRPSYAPSLIVRQMGTGSTL